jgi:hypothetical protein
MGCQRICRAFSGKLANLTVGWSHSGSPWLVLCLLRRVRYFIEQARKASSISRKLKNPGLLLLPISWDTPLISTTIFLRPSQSHPSLSVHFRHSARSTTGKIKTLRTLLSAEYKHTMQCLEAGSGKEIRHNILLACTECQRK